MNKTIFNLNVKVSTIIMSSIGIVFAFLSNAFYVKGVVGYILYLFRIVLFCGVFLCVYATEKNEEFKETMKRIVGYFGINLIFNSIFALFSATHLLTFLFITLSSIICVYLIVSLVFEILNVILNKKYIYKIIKINEKITLKSAHLFIKLLAYKR